MCARVCADRSDWQFDAARNGGVAFRRFQLSATKDSMHKDPSRREFLGTIAAFSLFPLEEEKPEMILHNGNIHTVNAKEPHAQAIAIARGRIIAIGSDAEVLNGASPLTR